MIKKCNFLILFTIFISMLVSCSNENKTASLIEDKLETMSGKEMLRDLLIQNDSDFNQLSRIFECSPSSLKRILEGETFATTEAENQFKNALNQTLITKEKTLDELDPYKQTWSYKIKHFFEKHYVWFIVLLCALFFAMFADWDTTVGLIGIFLAICFIIYIIVCSYIWYKGEPLIVDNYKNTLDPIWELLK